MRIAWQPRRKPLAPVAVAAMGASARELARRILARQTLEGLSGVAGDGVLVVLGREEDLPWADGVVYLGRDPGTPRLVLPTTSEPEFSADLLERAVFGKHELPPPVAVVAGRIVSLASARAIERETLARWLAREGTC